MPIKRSSTPARVGAPALAALCFCLIFSAAFSRPSPTFYQLIPFEPGEYGYTLSAVSDSSIWFSTNRGVYHYDGKQARKMLDASAFTRTIVEMLSVDALSDSEVWALGHEVKNWKKTMYRFNGREWQKIDFPQALDDPNDDLVMFRLKMFREGNLTKGYVAGQDGLVYFYDGARWRLQQKLTEQIFRALQVISPGDVWVGGRNGAIFQFDGKDWRSAPLRHADSRSFIMNFSFLSPDNGWAVGTRGIWHYDGVAWDSAPSPVASYLRDVEMISPTDGWIISQNGDILRYNGEQWSLYQHIPNNTASTLRGLQVLHNQEPYRLYFLTTNGLYRSTWERIPTFTDISPSVNLHWVGGYPEMADFDDNRFADVYLHPILDFPTRLYSNRRGIFTEKSDRLHPPPRGVDNRVTFADLDNNALVDIYLHNPPTGNLCYDNLGSWKFRSRSCPLPRSDNSKGSIAFADFDADGDLDLLFLSIVQADSLKPLWLYENDGIGNFTNGLNFGAPTTSNAAVAGIVAADFNNDGLPDIFKYDLNDPCELYLNEGNFRFRETAAENGIDGTIFEAYPYISGALTGDVNNDGALDILLVWREGQAIFFLNDGKARFSPADTLKFDDPFSFNVALADIDCDGDADLFFNGQFYENNGGKFSNYSEIGFKQKGIVTLADFDYDGDADLWVMNLETARLRLYENNFNPKRFLTVKLRGIRSNSQGIGAKATLWRKEADGRSTRAASHQLLASLPLQFYPEAQSRYDLEVIFPGGKTVRRENVAPGYLEISEFSGPLRWFWEFASSLRRSVKYADAGWELGKLPLLLLLAWLFLRIAEKPRARKYLAHPLLAGSLALLYLLSIHATIREGHPYSAFISLTVFGGAGTLASLAARRVVQQRESRYISHYKLLEFLGKGGMGQVYKAIDVNTKKIVALKILHEDLLHDPENRKRFAGEGQLLSSFSHRHIVKVFEIGEAGSAGMPTRQPGDNAPRRGFIAMEYLPGGTLKDYLKQHSPLPLAEAQRLLLQIAEGLREIHARGIIHRDVKTGNVMLDGQGEVRIMDFGLSKSPLVSAMTSLGTVIGTLGYVAPEQITGMAVDHRADIFSFGVVIYELLTGQLPFGGENEMALIHAIFNTTPAPPSRLRPGEIDPEWDAIVARCLAKTPGERFAGMEEVLEALRGV